MRTPAPRRVLLADPQWRTVVERLVAARLVTADDETVQIAHESIARAWPRLSNWLEDDVEGQRVLRHLSASADAWEGMGRPDSELYRGVRLAQAQDWQQSSHPELTVPETDFLTNSVAVRDAQEAAASVQARHQARARRRTRLLVTGVVGLLVAALVAGVLAVRQQAQREAADLATRTAEASRVDDAAANAAELDRALLLAVEANRLQDSPQTRAVLAGLLSSNPALIGSIATEQPVQGLAVSPDGQTLLVGVGETGIAAVSDGQSKSGRCDRGAGAGRCSTALTVSRFCSPAGESQVLARGSRQFPPASSMPGCRTFGCCRSPVWGTALTIQHTRWTPVTAATVVRRRERRRIRRPATGWTRPLRSGMPTIWVSREPHPAAAGIRGGPQPRRRPGSMSALRSPRWLSSTQHTGAPVTRHAVSPSVGLAQSSPWASSGLDLGGSSATIWRSVRTGSWSPSAKATTSCSSTPRP